MIYYLIYTSNPRDPITREVLAEIAKSSSKNNWKNNITGILMGIQGKFLQYLEGGEEEVNILFERIKKDPRHKKVTCWIKGFSTERVFKEWSMASWLLSNKELEELEALDDLKKFIEDPVNSNLQSKKFIDMINNLLKTWIDHEPERLKKNGNSV